MNGIEMIDTKSLSDFIKYKKVGYIGMAKREWLRRFGKEYPYHPSYSNSKYEG